MPVQNKNIIAQALKEPVYLRQHYGRNAGSIKVTRWLKVSTDGRISYVEKREGKTLLDGKMELIVSYKLGQIVTVTTYKDIFPSNKQEYSKMYKTALKSLE